MINGRFLLSVGLPTIYNYDKLLLWLDGTDFLDHSKFNRTITATQTLTLTTSLILSKNVNVYLSSNGYMYTQASESIDMLHMTFSAWVNILSTNTYSGLFGFGKGNGATSDAIDMRPSLNNHKWSHCTRTPYGSDYVTDTATVFNLWLFVCMVLNGNSVIDYINGNHIYTKTQGYFRNYLNGYMTFLNTLFIDYPLGTCYATDDRIYNYSFTAEEILLLYLKGPLTHHKATLL